MDDPPSTSDPSTREPPQPVVTFTNKPLPPVAARAQWEKLAAIIRKIASRP
jgi:hypothetical protein